MYNLAERLSATLLEALVNLGQAVLDGKGAKATIADLATFLNEADKERFNRDMAQCIVVQTAADFSVSHQSITANILPHYAKFLGVHIARGLMYYDACGVPTSIELTTNAMGNGHAVICWAYAIQQEDLSTGENHG